MKSNGRHSCLLVINSLAGGGAERVFTTLVDDLARFQNHCDFTVALLDNEDVEPYALPAWINVHRIDSRGSLLRSVTGLRKLVNELRPDICLSFLTRANFASVIACGSHGGKTIISERVNTTAHLSSGPKSVVSRGLVRFLYPRADAVVAVSDGVKDTLCREYGVSRDRVAVIPNPFDIDRIGALGADPPPFAVSDDDWATMGRLVPTKNTALAIRAFAQAKPAGRLFVLGDGPLRQEIEDQIDESGLRERVQLCGFLANPYAVVNRCEGYILPSNAEGFPNAMVEAMALGKPVVATDCPSGPAEVLDTRITLDEPAVGRGGMLVRCGDEKMMVAAIQSLQSEELRKQLGNAARARAADFSVERATNAFWSIIQNQLATLSRRHTA